MGVRAFSACLSLIGVVAQRLVRQLCPECPQAGGARSRKLRVVDTDVVPEGGTIYTRWVARPATNPVTADAPAFTNADGR